MMLATIMRVITSITNFWMPKFFRDFLSLILSISSFPKKNYRIKQSVQVKY